MNQLAKYELRIEAALQAVPLMPCGRCYPCHGGSGSCYQPQPDYPALTAAVLAALAKEEKG